jgi:zinc protease
MESGITRLTLSNGLLVLLKEIHTAPIASQWLWYRVGSRDEVPGFTGLSHWVEHMQFKGTPRFPAGVLDRAVSRLGGVWNAFTYIDWTTYYETLPAKDIDLALQIESDRMANSLFDPQEVESERTVIISEREGSENEPVFRLSEALQKTAFQVHPYRTEVIGEKQDLLAIRRDDLVGHYHTYYVPNNAVLAVSGDFETQQMLSRIRELYEVLPPGDLPPRPVQDEPEQTAERRLEVSGPGETHYLELAYHAPDASSPDFWPFHVLDSLLSGPSNFNLFGGGISNKTSRLYRALIEKEIAVSFQGGMMATIDPYLYSILITLRPDRTAGQALQAVEAEIDRIQQDLPSIQELLRAEKQARALFAYGSESISNQGFWMGFSEMIAGYSWFTSFLDRVAQVTPEDVQRVARKYLIPQHRTIGEYLPTGEELDGGEEPEAEE